MVQRFFIVDYEAENNKKNKEIAELETSKVFKNFYFGDLQLKGQKKK